MSFPYYSQNNILIEKLKSVYFFIPKVACTSIKSVIAQYLGLNNFDNSTENTDVHHQIDFPYIIKNEAINTYQHYFKFAFVRNPWDRLVSCYKNKITDTPNLNNITYVKGVGVISLNNYGVNRFYAGMSFQEFVDIIADTPDETSDDHFKSQTRIISDNHGNIIPDYIGKFENISKDFMYVLKHIRLSEYKLPNLNKSSTQKTCYQNFFNKKTEKIILKRYEQDINNFMSIIE